MGGVAWIAEVEAVRVEAAAEVGNDLGTTNAED